MLAGVVCLSEGTGNRACNNANDCTKRACGYDASLDPPDWLGCWLLLTLQDVLLPAVAMMPLLLAQGSSTTTSDSLLRLASAVSGGQSATASTTHKAVSPDKQHWVSCYDDASGHVFFKELYSAHTQWEPPQDGAVVNNEWRYDPSHSSNGRDVWLNISSGAPSYMRHP